MPMLLHTNIPFIISKFHGYVNPFLQHAAPPEKNSKIDGISAQNQIFRKKKKPDFL